MKTRSMIRSGTWTCYVRQPQTSSYLLDMMQNTFYPCSEEAGCSNQSPRGSIERWQNVPGFSRKLPRISSNLKSGSIAIFGLKIVRELWDRASKRSLIQGQT